MRYFGKALVSNTISVIDGRRIPFVEIGGGNGVIATDDAVFLSALETRIREKRGGVWEMSESDYSEALKKKTAQTSPQESQLRSGISPQELSKLSPRQSDPAAEAPAASERPAVAQQPAAQPAQQPAQDRPQQAQKPTPHSTSRPTVGKLKR